ncbi:hypothetical protein [Sphingobacterium litopenaei]|uniref:Uncharacterized protein n=1 Tax=Sphingobacterium litopenaei TaxID=2763500 RepID=A0ABR7YCD0_9SPHI|nr:hypothetical protein [Sphingobacterium litopenaei]MBD1428956.1 hypothetical protein [Sphingobacterium litopenaei]
MSMTQIAFIRKADLPTNGQIQETIQKLGYDFKILSGLDKQIDEDGLECNINGHQTYFETYVDIATNTIEDNEADYITDITDQDTAISFVWGADFAAGACIGLISLALIDHSNALIYYMDDQMKYSREMLVADTPQFLEELQKQSRRTANHQEPVKPKQTNTQTKNTFWNRLKNIFK